MKLLIYAFCFTFCFTFVFLGGCHQDVPKEGSSPQIDLVLNWFPEAEHGGFYTALINGFYKEEGLDVNILSGGPGTPVTPRVLRRPLAFGVTNADQIIYAQAQKIPVVAVMVPIQNTPRCILVHEDSGINSLLELKNITLAISRERAFAKYLMKKIPLENVKIVPYTGNVVRFLLEKNYAQQGYVFSEPIVARQKGARPKTLMLSEIGFNLYTSILFTTQETIDTNPELVKKLVRASIKGWEFYLENPDKTNLHIHKLNPQMEIEVLKEGVQALRPLAMDDYVAKNSFGQMSKERWSKLVEQMEEINVIPLDSIAVNKVFTNQFINTSKATK